MSKHRLWKDNRIDQEYRIGATELQERFLAWLKTKGMDFVNYYNTERIIRFFLTDKEGMSSVFEESEFAAFVEDLGPMVHQFETSAI